MLKISSHSCQILVTLVSNRNTSSPTAVLLFGLLLPLRSDILCLDTGGWEQAPMLSHSQLPRWREKIRAIPADLLLSHSHQLSAVKRWLAALSCPRAHPETRELGAQVGLAHACKEHFLLPPPPLAVNLQLPAWLTPQKHS